MDRVSAKTRSRMMSRIRSRGNKDTELALAKLLCRHGIKGWRRHVNIRKAEYGKWKFSVRPDFVFRPLRLAIFVDGCFWHSCPWHKTMPKSNRAFWRRKLLANIRRDQIVNWALRTHGWRVLRIWEHELSRKNEARLLRRIQKALRS